MDLKTSTKQVTVGRRPNCTAVFEDNRISGLHTRIYKSANDDWILEDLRYARSHFTNSVIRGICTLISIVFYSLVLVNADSVSVVCRKTYFGSAPARTADPTLCLPVGQIPSFPPSSLHFYLFYWAACFYSCWTAAHAGALPLASMAHLSMVIE